MSRPWMPLYVSDYLGDTKHLSTTEHGAYLLLLMHYWQRGGLPDDDERLARIVVMSRDDWRAIRPTIQAFFHDGWQHKRIDAEFTKSTERARAGRQGGRPKAKPKQNESKSEALQLQPHKESESDRARDPPALITPRAHQLADECLRANGFDPVDPPVALSGLPYQAQVWVARGYDPATVIATFSQIVKNKPPLKPLSYFVQAIDGACTAPAPVKRQPPQGSDHGTARDNNLKGHLAVLRDAEERLRASALSPGGEDAPRLLSHG
jgi:uncharacterized protein YdaU (DUF1376 family)